MSSAEFATADLAGGVGVPVSDAGLGEGSRVAGLGCASATSATYVRLSSFDLIFETDRPLARSSKIRRKICCISAAGKWNSRSSPMKSKPNVALTSGSPTRRPTVVMRSARAVVMLCWR